MPVCCEPSGRLGVYIRDSSDDFDSVPSALIDNLTQRGRCDIGNLPNTVDFTHPLPLWMLGNDLRINRAQQSQVHLGNVQGAQEGRELGHLFDVSAMQNHRNPDCRPLVPSRIFSSANRRSPVIVGSQSIFIVRL